MVVVWALIATTQWEKQEDGKRPGIGEIWHRFPKFIIGFFLASIIVTLYTQGYDEATLKKVVKSALMDPMGALRGWAFIFCFLSIGLTTRFRELNAVNRATIRAFSIGVAVNVVAGYLGRDPILTPGDLERLVEIGDIRFVMLGGFALGPATILGERPLAEWVRDHGRRIDPALWRDTPDAADRSLGLNRATVYRRMATHKIVQPNRRQIRIRVLNVRRQSAQFNRVHLGSAGSGFASVACRRPGSRPSRSPPSSGSLPPAPTARQRGRR